jgi:hypothetical protein
MTTTNIASELILYKDLVEHQQKLIIELEKKVQAYKNLASNHAEQRDSYKNLFNTLRTQHQNYIDKVTKGLDSILDDRLFKF